MATKQQEREALDKIREILNGLGEESYLGFAFAGCLNDAEMNIDEDAAYSYKERYEFERKKVEKLTAQLEDAKGSVEAMGDRVKAGAARMATTQGQLEAAVAGKAKAEEEAQNLREEVLILQEEVACQEETVIGLKAKLYDFMVKEEAKC